MLRILLLSVLSCICIACTTHEAPVIDGWKQGSAATSDYRVQPGDSVYSIAWALDMDYRELAQANHLQEPYHLSKGQVLHMPSGSSKATKPVATFKATQTVTATQPTAITTTAATQPASKPASQGNLLWPTVGKVTKGFSSATGGNRGIDISGNLDQPIVATATGKVVYTGASLPGYGNLIIIKHSDNQLSAYAFNRVIAVKEGQMVKAGQLVAKMGVNDAGKPTLHFEIRESGKPVDPMLYLANR